MTGATARQAEAPPTNEPLDAALAYARRGWCVLPVYSAEDGGQCTCEKGRECESPGKHPRTRRGGKDATIDEGQIKEWWTEWPDSNVGIATGNGLIVLDVDGREGFETLRKLQDQYGNLSETYAVRTGRGLHYYYLWPDSQAVRNSAGKLGPGMDVRANGGYVVAPPSLHRNGHRYNVAYEAEVADLPPKWVEAIKQPNSKAKSLPVPVTTQPRSHSRAKVQPTHDAWQRLQEEAERIANAKPGEQEPAIREGAYGIGLQVGADLLDHSDAKAILIAAGLHHSGHRVYDAVTLSDLCLDPGVYLGLDPSHRVRPQVNSLWKQASFLEPGNVHARIADPRDDLPLSQHFHRTPHSIADRCPRGTLRHEVCSGDTLNKTVN